jgi:hypothetical protein
MVDAESDEIERRTKQANRSCGSYFRREKRKHAGAI